MKKISLLLVFFGILFISSCNNDDGTATGSDCVMTKIIDENTFNELSTENYQLDNIILNDNCMEITLTSTGCDGKTWELNLYGLETTTIEKPVKLELINEETCLAIVKKTISFNLTPLRVEGQNEVLINIEGWNEPIIYQY